MPLTYVTNALRAVVNEGAGMARRPELLGMAVWAVISFVVGGPPLQLGMSMVAVILRAEHVAVAVTGVIVYLAWPAARTC